MVFKRDCLNSASEGERRWALIGFSWPGRLTRGAPWFGRTGCAPRQWICMSIEFKAACDNRLDSAAHSGYYEVNR